MNPKEFTQGQKYWINQRGISLVSLMVGLALALICVIVAMHTYRVSVLATRDASVSAKTYNATAALSIQLQKLLPQAGWGIGATATPPGGRANVDFVLLQGASATQNSLGGTAVVVGSVSAQGNALVWATKIDGSVKCYAIVSEATAGVILRGPQDCVDAATAAAGNWTTSVLLVAPDVFPQLAFSAAISRCWPYGGASAAAAKDSVQVSVTGTRYALPQPCLTNISL